MNCILTVRPKPIAAICFIAICSIAMLWGPKCAADAGASGADSGVNSAPAPVSSSAADRTRSRLDKFLQEHHTSEDNSNSGGDSAQPIQPATLPEDISDSGFDLPKPPPPGVRDETKQHYDAAVRAYYDYWNSQFSASGNRISPATQEKYDQSVQAYYEYEKQGLQHRHQVFEFQYRTSIVIFGVVIMLVLLGMYFSWMQFRTTLASIARRYTQPVPTPGSVSEVTVLKPDEAETVKPTATEAGSEKSPEVTSMKFSKDGVEVTSSVLGVIILIVSFAFFYLYLTVVYPIVQTY